MNKFKLWLSIALLIACASSSFAYVLGGSVLKNGEHSYTFLQTANQNSGLPEFWTKVYTSNFASASSTNDFYYAQMGSVGASVATEDIDHNSFGYITTSGLVRDIPNFTFNNGIPLYLSTNDGRVTETMPEYPVDAVMVGECQISNETAGVMLVTIKPVKTWSKLDSVYAKSFDTNGIAVQDISILSTDIWSVKQGQ